MKKTIEKSILESIMVKEGLMSAGVESIEQAARTIIDSLKGGGKILIFGNGGSAADSQHMAAELVGRFKKERHPIPAIALTVNTSILTALANDYGYDVIFSRQVEALGRKGDIALGISTSGNANNVISAVKKARELGLKTICLAGGDGGKLRKECDVAIVVGAKDTPRVQEAHITVIHILCELIEDEMCK